MQKIWPCPANKPFWKVLEPFWVLRVVPLWNSHLRSNLRVRVSACGRAMSPQVLIECHDCGNKLTARMVPPEQLQIGICRRLLLGFYFLHVWWLNTILIWRVKIWTCKVFSPLTSSAVRYSTQKLSLCQVTKVAIKESLWNIPLWFVSQVRCFHPNRCGKL